MGKAMMAQGAVKFGLSGVLLVACGSAVSDPKPSNAAGAAGSLGGSGAMAGSSNPAGSSGSAGSGGDPSVQCPSATPALLAGATGKVSLPIQVTGAGTPLATGQQVDPEGATPYKISLLKFFISEPVLLKADGSRIPGQLLDGAGTPRPYGLLMVDLEDPATLSVSLAAPSGDYAGLELGIGVPAACNGGDPTTHVFPLNADSDMYWTWGSQYLFIRVEGSAKADGAWSSFVHHVGFQQAFRITQVTGAVQLTADGASAPSLHLDIDRLLVPPTAADPTDVWVADNFATRRVLTLAP